MEASAVSRGGVGDAHAIFTHAPVTRPRPTDLAHVKYWRFFHPLFLCSSFLQVWTPYGGWWATPAAWKRNTAIAHVGVAIACAAIFSVSSERERRPIAPWKHIPSQRWCTHAKEDDPSLP